MDSLDEITKSGNGKNGFIKHVFNFNEDSKSEMLNIIQYAVLALIPVIILNKLTQKYIPEADEDKSSIEIVAEILAQVIAMFLFLLIIHRIVTFFPTYSGQKYAEFSVTNIILAILVIILSLQTKLGEKVSIIVDRIADLWNGPKDTKNVKNGNIKVSQPISQNQIALNQSLNSAGSSSGTTSISSLPQMQNTMTQQIPDFNQMYQQQPTPLVDAATPGMDNFEPLAANAGGVGSFGSAFGW
uniref:Uncharacterized protein n=1 Tax=viral metagenome TaxID=1070528 RepID=A0A6C0KSP7_9ZZZZ